MLSSKISKAKAKLLVEYPLFGTIASRLELVQNDDIQAFKSDGIKLEYNSDFFAEIELSQIEFALANGAMHASLAHEQRKNNRSGWLWQMATDFAVNDMLVQNGMDCPHQANYRVRFEGMYAEEIYAELKDDMLRDGELEYDADDVNDINPDNVNSNTSSESSQGQKLNGREEVNSNSSTESNDASKLNGLEESSLCNYLDQKLLDKQLFEEFAKSTIEKEIKTGEVPKSMERFFNLDIDSKIDWRNELRVALDRFYKDDYTLLPPNKKFLHLGFYLPSAISQRFKLVIAIDSSGSVDEELLNTFLAELNFLMNTIPSYEIDLIVCDDKIHTHKTFYNGDILEVDLIGGGATDFKPVFEYIKDELQDVKLLLYFTDLDGFFPKIEPSYDVKWISSKKLEVPFGKIILLQD